MDYAGFRRRAGLGIVGFLLFLPFPGAAQLTLRVVDTGPGLCTITEVQGTDGPVYMVYDAGHGSGDSWPSPIGL